MRATTALALALVCIVVVAAGGAIAHNSPSHVAAITITPSDDRSSEGVRVTTTLKSGKAAVCTFKYQTATLDQVNKAEAAALAPKPKPVVAGSGAAINFEEVIGRLQGSCVTKRVDYWEYEVCFGGAVRQLHQPDVYVLGTTGTVDAATTTVKYRDGLICDGLPDRPPRKVDVKFACDKHASVMTIARVAEVSTCTYHVLMASTLFCSASDKRFEDITGQAALMQPSSSAPSNADPSAEDWYVELKELADGRAMCSVYSLEPRSLGSKLHFRAFDLALERTGGGGGTGTTGAALAAGERPYTARHPGRVDCADDEIAYTASAGGNTVAVRNSDAFTGKLAYLKAYV